MSVRGVGLVLCLVGLVSAGVGCGEPECVTGTGGLGEPSAWERALLEGPGLPQAPEPSFLMGEEGVPLAYRTSGVVDDPPTVVVFVHGSSAHSREYSAISVGLANVGVQGRLVDVRGHGLSICRPDGNCSDPADIPRTFDDNGRYYPGRIGDARDANQFVRDLSAHLADIRSSHPEARLCLAGHSSGAGLVSRYVENVGFAGLDAVALVAPHHHAEQPQNEDLEVCGGVLDNGYAVVDLGAVGAALRGDKHRYTLSFRKEPEYTDPLDTLKNSFTTMLGMQTSDATTFLDAYTEPILWVAAEDDALLELEVQRQEFEKMPGGGAFVVFEETSHVGLAWSVGVGETVGRWCNGEAVEGGNVAP